MKFVAAFSICTMLILILIALLPIDENARYDSLELDASRLKSVHQRITIDPTPIDVAFVGSSHTMTGVDDFGIQTKLAESGIVLNVVNLGVTWPGRDLQLLLVKQLLIKKSPKLLIIEINEHEPPYGHPLTPYVGTLSDIFCCRFYLDIHFPKSLLSFLHRQVINTIISTAGPSSPDDPNAYKSSYGWDPIDRQWAETPDQDLDQLSTWRENFKNYIYKISAGYGIGALNSISVISKKKGVRIAFLNLPEFRYANVSPIVDIQNYLNFGPVLSPSRKVLTDRNNYFDSAHLNTTGARALVPFIANEIRNLLITNIINMNSSTQWINAQVHNN